MQTIVVIGASRGIGLELVRQYAASGCRVNATTRSPDEPGRLGEIGGDVIVHGLDVCSRSDVQQLHDRMANERVDVLIHNAGVKGDGMSREAVMAINAQAPIDVTEALMDLIAPGGRVVLMSSQLGARRGREGSLGLYGDSKAALNDAFRARVDAWRERNIHAAVMHPGWVRTDMGGASAPVSVEESAEGIRAVVASLDGNGHGRFLTWQGEIHPW